VRTLDDRTLTFDVQPDDIVNDVKELVEQREGIPIDEQRLTLGGIPLDDELTLDECRVEDESTLYVLLDLEGGGKNERRKITVHQKKTNINIRKLNWLYLNIIKLKIQVKSIVYVGNVHQNNAVLEYLWPHIMIEIIVVNVV